jgi:hypothetical protein
MKLRRNCAALVAVLALVGCAATPAPNREAREVIELLDYYGHLATLPSNEQLRAYQDALANFEQQPGDMQRLHLALALALPRVPWRDDARVLQLIESIAEAPIDHASPRRDLALILHNLVSERLRQTRDEQRKAEDMQKRLQTLLVERQRQLQDEHRRVEDLQEKLDALRTIDRDTRHKTQHR